MKGIMLQEVTKEELIGTLRALIEDEVLVLMTPMEAAALLMVHPKTITVYLKEGRLKDYSTHNQHRKISAKEVLKLRREKQN